MVELKKKGSGRSPNTELLEQVIEELRREPKTIQALAEILSIPRRTAYRYVELASKSGCEVIKKGFTRDSPYQIK